MDDDTQSLTTGTIIAYISHGRVILLALMDVALKKMS